MKPFVVKPFVVNIDWTKWPPPQWQFSVVGWLLFGYGLLGLIAAQFLLEFSLSLIGMTVIFVASGFWGVASFVRETNKSREELTKRVTEQDERIRKLEEQLAALTARADK